MPNYAKIAKPLGNCFKFEREQLEAFNEVKRILSKNLFFNFINKDPHWNSILTQAAKDLAQFYYRKEIMEIFTHYNAPIIIHEQENFATRGEIFKL